MKKKLCVAALLMSGCGVMMFAATKTTDPCAEKYKTCTDSCATTQSQAQRRGVDRLQAENAFNRCVKDCDKKKADCDGKAAKP